MAQMRLTRHNGRSNKNGVYSPSHNDRSFNLENADHINPELSKFNIYWDCYNGFRQLNPKQDELLAETFADVEDIFYSQRYADHVKGQHERNVKNRNTRRDRTTTDIRKHKNTCPEESVFQIGTIEEHVEPEVLVEVVNEFLSVVDERYGDHIHVLDWALHMDEGTPHIHERHVFDCENQYGELFPQQEKTMELLGFELPHPEKKAGKNNNRKMTYDAVCRVLLFDICKKHGLTLIEEPEEGGRIHLEKQDYILMKQRQQLAEQGEQIIKQADEISKQKEIMAKQEDSISQGFEKINDNRLTISKQNKKLEELTLKIDDVESLIDEVADVAYEKAVEVVTDAAITQTHEEDIATIKGLQGWLKAPERKDPKEKREYAVSRLDSAIERIKKSMGGIADRVKEWLVKPEVKKAGKEAVKNSARESIYTKLARGKAKADAENQARWNEKKQRKQDMEL